MGQIQTRSAGKTPRRHSFGRTAAMLTLAVGLATNGVSAVSAQQDGGIIANACTSCHGVNGRSQTAIPTIAGLDPLIFVQMMNSFANDTLMVTIMNRIAKAYTAEEITILANYFAAR